MPHPIKSPTPASEGESQERPTEPGFWHRSAALGMSIVVWREGNGELYCAGETSGADISRRHVDHLPSGRWSKAIPSSDIAALRDELEAEKNKSRLEQAHESEWADQYCEWLDEVCSAVLGDDVPADTEEASKAAIKRAAKLTADNERLRRELEEARKPA